MAKKHSMQDRLRGSYESRDKGGSTSNRQVLDWKLVEGDVHFFAPKKGKIRLNIIPYTIASKDHPLVRAGEAEIGEEDYKLDIWVHRRVGAAGVDVICPKKTFAKACPICDAQEEAFKAKRADEAKALKASRKVFYNVVDLDNPTGGVQVFEASHYLFEKELIEAAHGESDDGMFVDFTSPEEGKVVKFRAEEEQFGGNDFLKFKGFVFETRDDDEAVKRSQLKAAISFDSLMIAHTPAELEKIMLGADEDEESDEDERPARKAKKPVDDSDEDDEPAPRRSKAKVEEDDEDEPAPKKSKKPVEDDEDDDPPAKAEKAKGECPHGHTFGVDNDETKDCDRCKVWDACLKAGKK